ncbi:hypothetical protein AB0C34_06745 [Nocardia sp. NPDC049220]
MLRGVAILGTLSTGTRILTNPKDWSATSPRSARRDVDITDN